MAANILRQWNTEDSEFWEREGRAIANRNLYISIPALTLAFAVWMVWSVIVVDLPRIGFRLTTRELFWLAALPALCGAALRLLYAFLMPMIGGRRFTALSTASLLVPALGIGFAVRDPDTSYSTLVVLALLCGLGGGNFASSMANINLLFPKSQKGTALGLNAGLGNLGVSLAQFIAPAVVTVGVFGTVGGASQLWTHGDLVRTIWLQNAGFVWVPFILVCALAAWYGMNDLAPAATPVMARTAVFKRKHSWIMCWLYLGTFGSFIGYSAGFPLLLHSQFPQANALSYAWLGPLIGALIRPLGGWLADKLGGAQVTLWSFAAMAAGVLGVLACLPSGGHPGNFYGFLALFLALFAISGIGNGSTFRMIPVIFLNHHLNAVADADAATSERAVRAANEEAAAALGLASAVGAFGGFFIPLAYGVSISLSGAAHAALSVFLLFYAVCIATTWWCYVRRGASMPC